MEQFVNAFLPDPGRLEKTNFNFTFTLFCGVKKGFVKVLETFVSDQKKTYDFQIKGECQPRTVI